MGSPRETGVTLDQWEVDVLLVALAGFDQAEIAEAEVDQYLDLANKLRWAHKRMAQQTYGEVPG